MADDEENETAPVDGCCCCKRCGGGGLTDGGGMLKMDLGVGGLLLSLLDMALIEFKGFF